MGSLVCIYAVERVADPRRDVFLVPLPIEDLVETCLPSPGSKDGERLERGGDERTKPRRREQATQHQAHQPALLDLRPVVRHGAAATH